MAKKKEKHKDADLGELRQHIDKLDHKIIDLLNQRAEIVIEVGHRKIAENQPVYSPDREQAILKRLQELNRGPLPQKTVEAIYRELMSGSFALEKPMRVAYLGPEGSFSHMAAMRKFGASIEYQAMPDFRGIFDEVLRNHCELGLVPIENSLGGGVIDTMDCFMEGGVKICAEVILAVHHNLLANCAPHDVRIIASKPEIFAQCRRWLSSAMSGVELLPVASSAKAASMAISESNLAAIGSELAAELYNLKIIYEDIEDNPDNQTRFFVIGMDSPARSGNDKTSIMFTTPHKAGALAEALDVFARHEVNLMNIDNRPSRRRNWEYYFFVDFEGHIEDRCVFETLEEVKDHCNELFVLGSYPRALSPI